MGSNIMACVILVIVLSIIINVECNSEGDILNEWKVGLVDPNNVLQSWDPTLLNPCSWFHVYCNLENAVTRVDLAQAGLEGPLLPELGRLSHLEYLQVQGNKFSGAIPSELGNLTNLISLGLSENQLTGIIPSSLGNLRSLRFMKLNSNNLSGIIPDTVIQLVRWGNLHILNVSDNQLVGTIHHRKSIGLRTTTIIQDPKA